MKLQIETRDGAVYMQILPENPSDNALLGLLSCMKGTVSGHGITVTNSEWIRSVNLSFVPRINPEPDPTK
jgi:hypothetical protein